MQGVALATSTDISLELSVLGDVSSRYDDNTSPNGVSSRLPSAMCLQHAQRPAPPLGTSPGPSGPTQWGHHIAITIPTV